MSLFERIFSLLGVLTVVACGAPAGSASHADAAPHAQVPARVRLLAETLNVSHVQKLRGKTVATTGSDLEAMLRDYNAKAHPRSARSNRIVLGAHTVTKGHVVATLGDDADLTDLVGDRAVATAQDLGEAGAVLGFDGDAMNGCGNGEVDALVLDPAAQLVYAVETDPCAG